MFDNMKKAALFAVALLLAACGKQHKAEGVVKDFLSDNLVAQDYRVSFTEIDSTRHITDSAMTAMRAAASKNAHYKGVKLDAKVSHGCYVFTRATIVHGRDTIVQTFYLDPELTQVVAFKEN